MKPKETTTNTKSNVTLSYQTNDVYEISPNIPLCYDRDMQTDDIENVNIKSPILSPVIVTVPTTQTKHRSTSSLSYQFNLISPTIASSPPVAAAKPKLTEEQRTEILKSESYKNFMSKATNRMEKILYSSNGVDPFLDYTEDDNAQYYKK